MTERTTPSSTPNSRPIIGSSPRGGPGWLDGLPKHTSPLRSISKRKRVVSLCSQRKPLNQAVRASACSLRSHRELSMNSV